MEIANMREAVTDAIRYWERRRIAYNVVLVLIVGAYFFAGMPQAKERLTIDLALGLFVLAVLANIAYCAAYPVDIFAQLSALRSTWLRYRWVLFAIGVVFAGIITRFFALGLFNVAV